MLITRGFGTCSGGSGQGDPIYVPLGDTTMDTNTYGNKRATGSEVLPDIKSLNLVTTPSVRSSLEEIKTTVISTTIKPSMRGSIPKF